MDNLIKDNQGAYEGETLSSLQEGDTGTREILRAEGASDNVDPSRPFLFAPTASKQEPPFYLLSETLCGELSL